MKPDLSQLFAKRNRGILLDVVVFVINLLLLRVVVKLSLGLAHDAETSAFAKLLVGLYFAGLFFLQPVGPILKRWSFHQRTNFNSNSSAGCLLFWFMVPYIVVMLCISGAASIVLSEVIFEPGSPWADAGIVAILCGFVLAFVNAAVVYRYFLKPKKEPRWKFLMTPQAEMLGDVVMFINVICFQILWGCLTASAIFWESMNTTVHGKAPGFFAGTFLRLLTVGALALLVYFPPRIFYLAIDGRRKITWLTILLANLPLIVGVVFFTPPARVVSITDPAMTTISGHRAFVLSAEEFYKEYRIDAQVGAKKYAGKYVAVTGPVRAVDITQGDALVLEVRLEAGGVVQWVHCRFDEDQIQTMKQLKEHQRVTLLGIGEAHWLGGPRLQHCVLLSEPPAVAGGSIVVIANFVTTYTHPLPQVVLTWRQHEQIKRRSPRYPFSQCSHSQRLARSNS
jgi:hypothetical protein